MNTHDHSTKNHANKSTLNTLQEELPLQHSNSAEIVKAADTTLEPRLRNPSHIMQLQRTIGNAATQRLLNHAPASNRQIQRSDDFDDLFGGGSDLGEKRQEDGPLPILNKTGDGYAYNEGFRIESVQLRGGRSEPHSEVFCMVTRSRYNKGVLRFSRNQGGDTFQRNAELSASSWELVKETPIARDLTVAQAEKLATDVHNSMTHYISGDCHDFADKLYQTLVDGQLPASQDDFM